MPSPFPGMDPYLESPTFWEEICLNLAVEIRSQLSPKLRPHYYGALKVHTTYDEIIFDDKTEPLDVPLKEYGIEIRKVGTHELSTVIEVLSTVSKRPGHDAYQTYRRKRHDLLRTDVHLLEIDLLRGGQRPPLETPLPDAPYFIFLSRGEWRPKVEIWPIKLSDALPVIPVPLLEPDPDVPVDLGRALQTSYDKAAYDLRIDYSQAPPKPELSAEDTSWLQEHLQAVRLR